MTAHNGVLWWSCADCGELNRHHYKPGQYRVQCRNTDCRARWEHTDAFRRVKRGKQRPRDRMFGLAPMKRETWRKAMVLPKRKTADQPLNEVVA